MAGTTLAACGSGERRVQSGNASGVLHFGNGTEPQSIDPHVSTGVPESRLQYALLEGLVGKDPATLEPVPGVAERWEVSEDGLLYRFHLRRDARWSDGRPLTAEDFRWSLWRALQPAMGNEYAYMLFPLLNAEAYLKSEITDFDQVGVKVIDEHTLELQLNAPTPYFLQLLDHHSYYPVPRHVIGRFGEVTDRFSHWTRPGNFVGNGPFTLVEWKLNKHVRVEKNPLYWDADRVRLNAVMFYPTENIATEERMFRSGQLHITNDIPVDKIPQYRARGSKALRVEPYLGSYFYTLNTTRPGLDDARVRRALAMAIDRQSLIDTVLHGVNTPAYAITPPGTLGYQPPKLFDFDPDEARHLLAEAGYPDGRGMPPLEILYNTHDTHRKIAVAIQQMWKKYLNISVSMLNQEWKVYLDTRDSGAYTICRYGWIGDYVDPNSFLDMWTRDSGNNKTGWSNPAYDELILRRIPNMKSQEERFAGFFEAETILINEMPIIPIYTYDNKHLVEPVVKGAPSNIMDYFSFKDMYLEADA
nr:MAG: peptide ABC transporter substrate-binding protein [Pseudomonadota bacterium]